MTNVKPGSAGKAGWLGLFSSPPLSSSLAPTLSPSRCSFPHECQSLAAASRDAATSRIGCKPATSKRPDAALPAAVSYQFPSSSSLLQGLLLLLLAMLLLALLLLALLPHLNFLDLAGLHRKHAAATVSEWQQRWHNQQAGRTPRRQATCLKLDKIYRKPAWFQNQSRRAPKDSRSTRA